MTGMPDGPLFHYCTNATFLSIVSTRSIWLSSLLLSNDSMEGRVISDTLLRLAALQRRDPEEIDMLRLAIDRWGEGQDGLAFCLSSEGDLLSQWRGYADDGHGVSIGFDKDYLCHLARKDSPGLVPSIELTPVRYESTDHEAVAEIVLDALGENLDAFLRSMSDAEERGHVVDRMQSWREGLQDMDGSAAEFVVLADAYTLKMPAFREEKEWRLLASQRRNESNLYRSLRDRLVPYMRLELPKTESPAILKVILGPKNLTPPDVVKGMLALHGFHGVAVERSAATYR